MRLWEVSSGREVRRFEEQGVKSICFSPDGLYALSGGRDGTVRLREVSSGWQRRCFEVDNASQVYLSGDGRCALSLGRDRTLHLSTIFYPAMDWRAITPYPRFASIKLVASLSVEQDQFRRLLQTAKNFIDQGVFQEAHRLLREGQSIAGYERNREILGLLNLAGVRGQARRTRLRNAWCLFILEAHTDWVTSVCFSRDGCNALSGGRDSTVRLWEVSSGRELRRFEAFARYNSWVTSVCFSPDGHYALSAGVAEGLSVGREINFWDAGDTTPWLWEVSSGRKLRCFEGHTNQVTSICFFPEGRYALSGSKDKTLRLWEVASGREVRRFEGHTNWVTSVCCSPEGRYALSGGLDGTVRLWEVSSGRELWCIEGSTLWVCFSSDGCYALSGGLDGTVRLWEVSSGRELRYFEGHTSLMNSVGFSPDGRYAPLLGGGYCLWEVARRGELRCFETHTDRVTSFCFSPDGRYALWGTTDNTAHLWEVDWNCEFNQ